MSAINVNSITGRTGGHGPVLTGVTTVSDGNLVVIGIGASIGIGTSAPAARLTVDNTTPIDTTNSAIVGELGNIYLEMSSGGTQGNGNLGPSINFTGINQSGKDGRKAAIIAQQTGSNSSQVGLSFWTNNSSDSNGVIQKRLVIGANGRVSIGTDSAAEELSVAGAIRVQNSTDATQYLTINHQGIDFQNTGAGSSSTAAAHVLDDYEEGTFTPAITSGITSPSLTSVAGHYVKVGTLVMCSIDYRFNGNQTGNSDAFRVGGLPFSCSADGTIYGSATIQFNNILSGFTDLRAGHFNELSEIHFYNGTSIILGNTSGVSLLSGRRMIMQLIYKSV